MGLLGNGRGIAIRDMQITANHKQVWRTKEMSSLIKENGGNPEGLL